MYQTYSLLTLVAEEAIDV